MAIYVDWNGVKSLIRWTPPNACVNCNVKFRIVRGSRCNPCHFSPASADRKTDVNFFSTGFQPKAIFKQYGVPDLWGKSQLFYFMFNQDLNNEYPYPISIVDIFGNTILQNDIDWILHHDNNLNWDDHIYNLILCLRHEHTYFEKNRRIFYKSLFDYYNKLLNGI